MTDTPVEQILGEIEELRSFFRNCRVYFPYMSEDQIGSTQIPTPPYYLGRGFQISFVFSQPLTADDIRRNNEIAHWINQNVIVRLYALMEYYRMLSKVIKIDQTIDGWKELDLLRRLRRIFAHKSGRYNPDEPRERTLVEELIEHFHLDVHDPHDFPLNIAEVIDPLFEGCKRYVQGKLGVV